MEAAFAEADKGVSLCHGGPFGAVVVKNGVVIGRGHNTVLKEKDPTCHAEMNAIRMAARKLKSHSLKGCTLITTAEPCPMCFAATYWSGIRNIYYAVGKETISSLGFSDKTIYAELRKNAQKRTIHCVRVPGLEKVARDLILKWRQKRGKLY